MAVGVAHHAQWLLGLPIVHICIPRPYFANGARVDEKILKAGELPIAALAFSGEESVKMVSRDFYDVSLGHDVRCNELIEFSFSRAGVPCAVRVRENWFSWFSGSPTVARR